jgi:DNA (cytosine-5)-methyltransferase 1
LKYLSVCSGIEAATVAWHPLGWKAIAYSEIEKFPSEVLAHHYPNTPNLGDMTKFKVWTNVSNVDVFVGGTPCQSFSVAGLRKGLDDPRGNLMLTYLAIAKQHRPNWLVWENVPGVLSSNGGRDFGSFLGGLAECGYGFAYRVLDAQFFGVAQRRRRVFVVGYLGDWRAAAAVLFERHSLQGHPAPSREKRQAVAASVGAGASSRSWPADISSTLDTTFGTKQGLENQHINAGCPMFVPAVGAFGKDVSDTVTSKFSKGAELLQQGAQNGGNCVLQPVYEMHGQDSRVRELGETCTTVTSKWGTGGGNVPVALQPIAFSGQMSNPQTDVDMTQTQQAKNPMAVAQPVYSFIQASAQKKSTNSVLEELSNTLTARAENNNFAGGVSMAVRRLTPVECERLQGFSDNYTDIKSKGKPTPDGPRYKALGNSMAVPVMAWIGARIQQYEDMQ